MPGGLKRDLKLVRDLLTAEDRERRSEGLDLCVAIASPEMASDLVHALSRNLLTGNERLRALNLLADLGLARTLEDVRADGWLDQLGAGVGGFEELCNIMGRPFVGFATLLGVQVTSLDVRADDVERSDVGFTLGDGKVEHLTTREFKRRIVAAITGDRPSRKTTEPPLDREKVIDLIGSRHVLLAALFDWALEWVYVAGPPRGPEDVYVDVFRGDRATTATLGAFAAVLREEVESEWQRYLDPLAGVDRGVVERARELARTDPGRVVDLLGGLFRFVLNYGRLSARPQIDESLLPVLCEGMALLGMAHSAASSDRARYGEEVIRLGIQTFPGVPGSERLHLALGDILVQTGRDAEAIAHLRRAAAMGSPRDSVEPLLVEALFRSGRLVAAAAIYAGLEKRLPGAAERVGLALAETIREEAADVLVAVAESEVAPR